MISARMISAKARGADSSGAGLIAPDFWWFFIRARSRGCNPAPRPPRGGGARARAGGARVGGVAILPSQESRTFFVHDLLLLPSFYVSNSWYHCQIKNHMWNIFCHKELLFLHFLETTYMPLVPPCRNVVLLKSQRKWFLGSKNPGVIFSQEPKISVLKF